MEFINTSDGRDQPVVGDADFKSEGYPKVWECPHCHSEYILSMSCVVTTSFRRVPSEPEHERVYLC